MLCSWMLPNLVSAVLDNLITICTIMLTVYKVVPNYIAGGSDSIHTDLSDHNFNGIYCIYGNLKRK